jgi:SHS2 domain-containing protein
MNSTMPPPAGFQERPHTADWALDVWAPDAPTLLAQAALGMAALMGIQTRSAPRVSRTFDLAFADLESLLVGFLTELLYLIDRDGVTFDQFDLHLTEGRLQATVSGQPIDQLAKEIKAVTYHNLRVLETERGLAATIVFDV